MNIYLARSFNEEVESGADWWSTIGINIIENSLSSLDCYVFDPVKIEVPKESYERRYNKCLDKIRNSDIVIADLSQASGVGVGCEIMFAKQIGKPVFIICPKNTCYRKYTEKINKHEWMHPFIYGVSDYIFENVNECILEIKKYNSRR